MHFPSKLVRWDVLRLSNRHLARQWDPPSGSECSAPPRSAIEALPVDRLVPQMPCVASIFRLGGVVLQFKLSQIGQALSGAPDNLNLDLLGSGRVTRYPEVS
jgi:hypothetical protein